MFKRFKYLILIFTTVTCVSTFAKERLEVYQDYDFGSDILSITTVKIDANMEDVYLAGLSQTWARAMQMNKEMGYIKDWKILASDLPQSGQFNMLLMVTFEKASDLEPNKERYNAFMKKWGEKNRDLAIKISAKYPEVRELTGQYLMREIKLK
ncbi:hypothetical protein [Thalassotalea sediminis]|uniref:hypothetical protein n=1 Tax=Thalassotalea sediminis TaxID=1759089 RepID=UPI0025747CC3|nr:hypothetical protein [Thalassotalea sediminis]